jgi:hypothetical protein
MYFHCQACHACRRRASRLHWLRWFITGLVAAYPLLALFIGVCVLRWRGVTEGDVAGRYLAAFWAPLLLAWPALFLAGCVFIHFETRRRVRRLFPPEIDAAMRHRTGLSRWGLLAAPFIRREPAPGVRVIELALEAPVPPAFRGGG